MNLQEISDRINSLPFDLRAEYLIAVLLSEGISQNDIMIIFDGILRRKWSTDINYAEPDKFDNGDETLSIHLNRTGIYDGLPEALFHSFSDNRNSTGDDMAKESMKLKAEEKQFRKFFRPFENEIFSRNVKIASRENNKFQILFSDLIDGFIPGFWKIDKRIPKRYMSGLTRLIPFAHQVAGDYNLTAMCLEYILDEKVTVEYRNEGSGAKEISLSKNKDNDLQGGRVGDVKLGYNMIAGCTPSGFTGRLSVIIGPLKNTEPGDFYHGGPAEMAIDAFYSYFIPVELDVETKLQADKKENNFVLFSKEDTGSQGVSYLGYNTII